MSPVDLDLGREEAGAFYCFVFVPPPPDDFSSALLRTALSVDSGGGRGAAPGV